MAIDNLEQIDSGDGWQEQAQSHFAKTGTFRPEDVARVLGNPWESVQVTAEPAIGSHYLTPSDVVQIFNES